MSSNRTSLYDGGGLYAFGSTATLSGCVFNNNSADIGGGMRCTDGSGVELTACQITNNLASQRGGGIAYDAYGEPVLTGCTVSGNTAKLGGGGLDN